MASYHFGLRDDDDVFSATLPGKSFVQRSSTYRSRSFAFGHVSITFVHVRQCWARAAVAWRHSGGVGAPWAGPAAWGRGGVVPRQRRGVAAAAWGPSGVASSRRWRRSGGGDGVASRRRGVAVRRRGTAAWRARGRGGGVAVAKASSAAAAASNGDVCGGGGEDGQATARDDGGVGAGLP
uniref:Uncharacterized protein n=1 Tax=Oryza sativa subsp. japonica TaxID=39947 RepID=Q6ZAC0_ORYSJ|nr:hypothetical protein [Oryza sativa Japonica Group]BAD09802.1 hypothetical protein [Oryza sativa Japonica Group]